MLRKHIHVWESKKSTYLEPWNCKFNETWSYQFFVCPHTILFGKTQRGKVAFEMVFWELGIDNISKLGRGCKILGISNTLWASRGNKQNYSLTQRAVNEKVVHLDYETPSDNTTLKEPPNAMSNTTKQNRTSKKMKSLNKFQVFRSSMRIAAWESPGTFVPRYIHITEDQSRKPWEWWPQSFVTTFFEGEIHAGEDDGYLVILT